MHGHLEPPPISAQVTSASENPRLNRMLRIYGLSQTKDGLIIHPSVAVNTSLGWDRNKFPNQQQVARQPTKNKEKTRAKLTRTSVYITLL